MKHIRKTIMKILLAAVLLFTVILAGRYVNAWQAEEDARRVEEAASDILEAVTVRRVVDGDTLLLVSDEKLRLLGIDAPESVHQDKDRNSVYGEQAAEHLKSLVRGGERIWILRPREAFMGTEGGSIRDTDNYGRLLRFGWTEKPDLTKGLTDEVLGESLNARMLKDGYAVTFFMEEGETYEDLFLAFRRDAESGEKGLWGTEGFKAYAALNYLGQ